MRRVADMKATAAGEPTRAEKIMAQGTMGEGQQATALVNALNRPRGSVYNLPEWIRKPMPEASTITEPFALSTNLPTGSRLQQYIESQIPDIVRNTRKAREDWWKEMHPESTEEDTYEGTQSRLAGEASRLRGVAESGSTAEYAGGTYFGEGGIAGVAQKLLDSTLNKLSGLSPQDYGTPSRAIIGKLEDPLTKALREKDFRAGYYRQAGTGLRGSLTPSARFR